MHEPEFPPASRPGRFNRFNKPEHSIEEPDDDHGHFQLPESINTNSEVHQDFNEFKAPFGSNFASFLGGAGGNLFKGEAREADFGGVSLTLSEKPRPPKVIVESEEEDDDDDEEFSFLAPPQISADFNSYRFSQEVPKKKKKYTIQDEIEIIKNYQKKLKAKEKQKNEEYETNTSRDDTFITRRGFPAFEDGMADFGSFGRKDMKDFISEFKEATKPTPAPLNAYTRRSDIVFNKPDTLELDEQQHPSIAIPEQEDETDVDVKKDFGEKFRTLRKSLMEASDKPNFKHSEWKDEIKSKKPNIVKPPRHNVRIRSTTATYFPRSSIKPTLPPITKPPMKRPYSDKTSHDKKKKKKSGFVAPVPETGFRPLPKFSTKENILKKQHSSKSIATKKPYKYAKPTFRQPVGDIKTTKGKTIPTPSTIYYKPYKNTTPKPLPIEEIKKQKYKKVNYRQSEFERLNAPAQSSKRLRFEPLKNEQKPPRNSAIEPRIPNKKPRHAQKQIKPTKSKSNKRLHPLQMPVASFRKSPEKESFGKKGQNGKKRLNNRPKKKIQSRMHASPSRMKRKVARFNNDYPRKTKVNKHQAAAVLIPFISAPLVKLATGVV